MPPPPDCCALCTAPLSRAPVQRTATSATREGAVWNTVCPSCGRVWITTAAWELLLGWHDEGRGGQRRAAAISETIKQLGRGQVVPIDLSFIEGQTAD